MVASVNCTAGSRGRVLEELLFECRQDKSNAKQAKSAKNRLRHRARGIRAPLATCRRFEGFTAPQEVLIDERAIFVSGAPRRESLLAFQ